MGSAGLGLPAAFALRAGAFADRTAVESPTGSITYGELHRRANQLAHALLRRLGEGNEPVALMLRHDIPAIVAVLGALEAGKLYVPIDRYAPRARAAEVLASSGASLLIVEPATQAAGQALGVDLLDVEDLDPRLPDDDPCLCLSAERPASILYTSGSTGKPKGVVLAHRSLTRLPAREIRPEDRQAFVYSIGFAGSVRSLFTPLLSGATLCPFDVHEHGVAAMARWIEHSEATLMGLVPSLYRALLGTIEGAGRLRHVREVALSGEQPLVADVELHRRSVGHARLVNSVGSSEAGAWASFTIDPSTTFPDGVVPAGWTLPGRELRIVDERGHDVADGEVGELVVRSSTLALGYWRDPQLTAERFGVDPDGVRTFRTGDLGYFRDDGCLMMVGRLNDRAKVRGNTVEMFDVERALLALDSVQEAAVRPVDRGERGTGLTAYVVPERGQLPTVRQLRAALGERLPAYMVPTSYVLLDALPRTHRGKLDRGALAEQVLRPAPLSSPYVEPRDSFEANVSSLFRELLDLDMVGADDDFFELGGDSLAAQELLAALRERFALELAPTALLEMSTVAGLARALEAGPPPVRRRLLLPVQPDGTRPPLFVVAGGGGTAVAFRDLAHRLGRDQPLFVLEGRGLHHRALPDRRVERAARRCVAEIRAVQPRGPYRLAGHSFGGLVVYEAAQQLEQMGETIALLALVDAPVPGLVSSSLRPPVAERLPSRVGRKLEEGGIGALGIGVRRAWARQSRRTRSVFQVATAGLLRRRGAVQYLAFYRLDVAVARRYRPKPYRGRVLVMRAPTSGSSDPALGWGRFVSGELCTAEAAGDHLSMIYEPYVAELAARLAAELDTAAC